MANVAFPIRAHTDVVVEEKGKVVGDQVLATTTEVEWVKVLELPPHGLESLFRNTRLRNNVVCQLSSAENIVPDLIDHLLRSDISFAPVS